MHWSIGIVLLVTVVASARLEEAISDDQDDTVTVGAEEASTKVATKLNAVDAVAKDDVKDKAPPCHTGSVTQETLDSDEFATRKFGGKAPIQLVVSASPAGHTQHYTTEAPKPYPYPPYPPYHYPPYHHPPTTRRPHWENHPPYHQPPYQQPPYQQPPYQQPPYPQPYPLYPPYWHYYYPGYPGYRPPYYGYPYPGRPFIRDGDDEMKSANLDDVPAEDKKSDEIKAPKAIPFFSFLNFGKF